MGIKPFGLPGHQLIGGIYSSQTFTSLTQDLRTSIPIGSIISGEIPLRDALSEVQIRETSGSWMVYYNFDQFLYTTKADGSQGIGIFGRIGFADRNTNIFEQFYSFGIAGQGMLPGRDHDRFGIGFYYTDLSSDLPGIFLQQRDRAGSLLQHRSDQLALCHAGYPSHRTGGPTRHHGVPDRATPRCV